MSNKQRKRDEIEDLKDNEGPKAPDKPLTPFAMWVDKLIKAGRIRPHQDEALLVFFRKKGLRKAELPETYEAAFKLF